MGQNKRLDDLETYGRIYALTRTVDHADTDVALEDTSAVIDLGDELPEGAVVLAIIANNTQDWTDGAAGTFAMDVGTSDDDDLFTPTALDIDNGVALLNGLAGPASGAQIRVTVTSSVDLDTATAGTTELTILYTAPAEQE